MFDNDGDGMLSKADLMENFAIQSLQYPFEGEEFIQQIIDEVDLDKDGKISFEEFNNGLTSVFLQ